jgi:hypothetical protein
MARKIIRAARSWEDDPLLDILGGTWLVALLLGLLHLPALVA